MFALSSFPEIFMRFFFSCYVISLICIILQSACQVVHFQYLNWPDHGIPPTTTGLMRMYKAACAAQPSDAGPMLVHCRLVGDSIQTNLQNRSHYFLIRSFSAGVGRTGTFIALDILSDQLAQENQINVFEAVYNMRLRRTDMVQSLVRRNKYQNNVMFTLHSFRGNTYSFINFLLKSIYLEQMKWMSQNLFLLKQHN